MKKTIIALAVLATLTGFGLVKSEQHYATKPTVVTVAAPHEPYRVLLPANYKAGQSVPLVIWFHGSGTATGNEEGITKFDTVKPNADAFVKAGYMVAASNAHGDNWGNAQSQQDYVDLYHYLNSKYKISGVYYWGTSMGGLDSLYVLRSGKIPAKAYIGMSPVTNLEAACNNYILGKSVKGQYDGCPTQQSPIDFQDYPHIPYLFYASYEDTYVTRADNLDRLDVPNKTVVTSNGDHTDPQNFVQPEAMVSFFNKVRYSQ